MSGHLCRGGALTSISIAFWRMIKASAMDLLNLNDAFLALVILGMTVLVIGLLVICMDRRDIE